MNINKIINEDFNSSDKKNVINKDFSQISSSDFSIPKYVNSDLLLAI